MSDQADKLLALVNELRWDQRKNDLTAEDVDTIENALLELQRLERSHTAPSALVEAVKAMVLLVEDYEAKTCKVIRAAITIGKSDWKAEAKERELAMHRMFEFLDVLRSALSAQEPKVCEWTYREDDDTWETGCGEEFVWLGDKPRDAITKFCCNCGSPIKVKE